MRTEYMQKIEAHVAAHARPNVVSIADDIHIFHFEDAGAWQNAQILFVNRNGHHFRLIKQASGDWLFVKNWNGIFDYELWAAPGLRNADPEALIRMCGVGPQGPVTPYETLALLPKGTTNRRKAVWRGTILDVRFDVDNDRFTISETPVKSASFSGKLWLSKEAAAWCRFTIGAPMVSTSQQPDVQRQDEEVMMELESSSMWGMF